MLAKVLCLCMLVGAAMAALSQGNIPKTPDELSHKEGCYVREINDVIPFNSKITPIGHCVRISCGTTMMSRASCGLVINNDPNCHKTQPDLTKPYPECCPTIECDKRHQNLTETSEK